MSDELPPHDRLPEAKVKPHRFSSIWLIPLIAALIAGYLGVRSYAEHGPTITISFRTAEGLSAGQTSVKYKSVVLGTVESIQLNEDHTGVVVHVRMLQRTAGILTDHARFWVQRQHLATTDLSDIVSGTYIQVDPGPPGGKPRISFSGLEDQPALPVEEPGTTYTVNAQRLGSIMPGAAVYYRDINAGKVLGYQVGDGTGPIALNVFVRAPYDKLVKPASFFWNASGISAKMGAGGLKIELQSLQSVLTGGIAFDTPLDAMKTPQADDKTFFSLYQDRTLAEAISFGKRIPCVTYMQSSIKDLGPGSPVQIFGIDVGQVTGTKLFVDPQNGDAKVRVSFEIEPEKVFGADSSNDINQIMNQLVQNGMRVKMESSNLIAGMEILSLEFSPKTQDAKVAMEDNMLVLPGQSGDGIDALTGALGDVAAKLGNIPFEQIGEHLDHLVASADKTFGGEDMQNTMHSLEVTLANAQELTQQAKQNLTPALQKLPEISRQLQDAVTQANAFMTSVNNGYGQDSEFQRNSQKVLDEANEAARSIRLLADYLDHHPEALLEGKTPDKGTPDSDKDKK